MQSDSSKKAALAPIPVRNGTVVLSGYALVVRVERGRLLLADGQGTNRREGRLSKATCRLKRLVILGHTGSISLEALRWLFDIDAAVVQIDADGHVILATAPLGADNAHLRRSQSNAYGTATGTSIVRHLLQLKLKGQAEVLGVLGKTVEAEAVIRLSGQMGGEEATANLRNLEGQAAAIYWSGWAGVPVNFARRDAPKVAEHWKSFGTRMSPLTDSPRRAANPANALLNYLYAILETETRIALLTVGLDPGLGLLHADLKSRDSLACDLMEAVRPTVDQWLLDYLKRCSFAARDFFERQDGTVRVTSRVTPALAETASAWAAAIAPPAEWVALELHKWWRGREKSKPAAKVLPTPLSQANRSAGRDAVRKSTAQNKQTQTPTMVRRCKECGSPIQDPERLFCSDACRDAHKKEVGLPKFAASGPAALAELRANGQDPSHGGEVGKARGRSNARRAAERAAWEAEHGDGMAERMRFKAEILPKLADVSINRIKAATGLSLRYCSLVRRGMCVPHPVHYRTLESLLEQ